MYIFLEKGEMGYLIGTLCATMIVAVFLVYIIYRRSNLRAEYRALKETNEKLKKQQEEEITFTKKLLAQQEKIEKGIADEAAQQRAAEAQSATEQLLAAEQRRLAAEMKSKKELEEVRFEQEKEKRQEAINLYFNKLNAQAETIYKQKKEELQTEITLLQSQFDDFRSRQDSINEAILREKELKEQEDFYSIQVSENDREDIKVLQSMDLRLHNRDVIPKLIWELYIRRPAQEMIKRITAGRSVSGIYKITYKDTKEAYIGKTTDISTRWQNHIKTAIGLEAAARSTLHTRMAKDGVWNYTFEILEEVPKDQLSMREAFYIDLYGTKQQLNMKEGSSK